MTRPDPTKPAPGPFAQSTDIPDYDRHGWVFVMRHTIPKLEGYRADQFVFRGRQHVNPEQNRVVMTVLDRVPEQPGRDPLEDTVMPFVPITLKREPLTIGTCRHWVFVGEYQDRVLWVLDANYRHMPLGSYE